MRDQLGGLLGNPGYGDSFQQQYRDRNPRPPAWDEDAELAKAKAANDAQTGILGWTTDYLRGLGLPEGTLSNLNSAATFAPVTSDILDIEAAGDDIGKAYDNPTWRNVGGAGLAATLAAAGLIPGAGEALGLLGSVGKRATGANPRMGALDSVDLPPGSDPRYVGAAPNRTEPYPRYTPASTTARMRRLEASVEDPSNPINKIFDNYVEKGKSLGGEDWYNTEEMRDWMVNSLGEKEGARQWKELMELIGTTSTGSQVPPNIRNASFYRALDPADRVAVAQIVKDEGITPLAAATRLGVTPPNSATNYKYGHKMQRNHATNVMNHDAGRWERKVPEGLTGAARSEWLQANSKVKGFGNDLLGDETNIAADMHFMRMLGMSDGGGDFLNDKATLSAENLAIVRDIIGPKRIKQYTTTRMVSGKEVSTVNLRKAWKDGHIKDTRPLQKVPTVWADTPKDNEYAAYEAMANRVAQRYGMTPAQFQASLWMGAGDITGLADASQGTFMDLFRRSLDKRAVERGMTRKEMLDDFIRNRAPLSVAGAGAAGLAASQIGREDPKSGLLAPDL
jgi:hypothetical protein